MNPASSKQGRRALPAPNRPPPARPDGRGLLSRTLGFDTLRGRFLYMAVALLSLLIALAWLVNSRVREVTGENTTNLIDRHRVSALTRDMSNDMWEVEQNLQYYMLQPAPATHDRFAATIAHLIDNTKQLDDSAWAKRTAGMHSHSERLINDLGQLRSEGLRLMEMRVSPTRTYPAIPIMMDNMQPRVQEFISLATLALDEAQEQLQQPGQVEVQRLFYDTLYAWSRMVDAFRLYVSNRFGIFESQPEKAMAAQATVLEEYSVRVTRNLSRLAELDKQGLLQFQQTLSLEQMVRLHREWHSAWRKTRTMWGSENWRLDTPMLQKVVQPLTVRIWSNIREVEKSVDANSAEDLSLLAQVAEQISRSLWLLVMVGLVVAALGLLIFELQIRRPIARMVTALKAEAAGKENVVVPETRLVETQDLAQAFSNMRDQVRSRQARLRTILDNTAEGIITFDEWGMIEGFNQSSENLFGWSEDEVIVTSIATLIAPEARETRDGYLEHFMRAEIQRLIGHEGEVTGRHKDGSSFPMSVKITGMQLEDRHKYIAMVSNISERKALMEHLRRLAEHDGLTGLFNRTYFQAELERVVERMRRSETASCALLYIDLDHFKYVNDTLGHAAGDKLLIEVAGVLHRRTRKSDLVARLGGDEFTVLVYDTTPQIVRKVAESFRRQLADYTFNFEGQTVTVGCSVGVAIFDKKVKTSAEVMSQADLACHLAKRAGRNQVHMFMPDDAKNVTTMSLDMGWSRRIRDAIDLNRFALACQPIVNTRTRLVTTYEVLIRMLDENGALIMPSGFLPTAERFGLSLDIDRWVIVNAIKTLAEQRADLPDLSYTINLSAQTLIAPSICDLVEEKLQATGLDPAALVFEITETAAIADMVAATSLLSRLRTLGCRTALDDFGFGMSSFAYLKELPVDIVKIDGRFVKNIVTSQVDQAMVRAMNDIAHVLGKETVAEFVESEEAFQWLVQLGVDYGQGYHLGRPDMAAPCSAIASHAGLAGFCRF